MIQVDVLQFLIEKGPGRTEIELARAIHGDKGYQQQSTKTSRCSSAGVRSKSAD